jgi:Viral BACON domain
LTIAGQTFTVTQAALVCSYSISPTSQRVGRGGGTETIDVSTSSGCAWTASSNSSWITITSGSSGTGSGTVRFSYTRNESRNDRSGTLTVAGRTATVLQNGGGGGNDDDDDDD